MITVVVSMALYETMQVEGETPVERDTSLRYVPSEGHLRVLQMRTLSFFSEWYSVDYPDHYLVVTIQNANGGTMIPDDGVWLP